MNEHVSSSSFNAWLSSEAQAKAAGYATRSLVASSKRAPKSAAQGAPWSSGSRTAAVARSSRPPPYGGNPSLELGGVERRAGERAQHDPGTDLELQEPAFAFDVKAGVSETVELTLWTNTTRLGTSSRPWPDAWSGRDPGVRRRALGSGVAPASARAASAWAPRSAPTYAPRDSCASPKGLPSESLQIAHASPGWTTLPPSASTRSNASATSLTAK